MFTTSSFYSSLGLLVSSSAAHYLDYDLLAMTLLIGAAIKVGCDATEIKVGLDPSLLSQIKLSDLSVFEGLGGLPFPDGPEGLELDSDDEGLPPNNIK